MLVMTMMYDGEVLTGGFMVKLMMEMMIMMGGDDGDDNGNEFLGVPDTSDRWVRRIQGTEM